MTQSTVPTLSISVVCYNTPAAEIQTLLKSLSANLRELRAQSLVGTASIALVDNSDHSPINRQEIDPQLAELESLDCPVELIAGQGNVGYGAGHNLVILKSLADYHLILNPDVELSPGCLAAGLEYLAAHSQVAMISPAATYPSGDKQYLCKRYPSVRLFFLRGFMPGLLQKPFQQALHHFEMRDLPEDNPSVDIPIISGCFMLGRVNALRAEGGFDERYFLYFEDFDLSLRIRSQGTLAYVPTMQIKHGGGHSAGKGMSHIGMFARSGRRFFSTHGWRFW